MTAMTDPAENKAAGLLTRIKAAVAAANEAEKTAISRAKEIGLLLLEAKKLHPKTKRF
jgi:hypothetical protein